VDKHNDEAGARYELLEEKLKEFIDKLDHVSHEMDFIRQQQIEILNLLNKKISKK